MTPPHLPRTPSLRRHKPSGLAVVTLSGRDHYPWPARLRKPPPDTQLAYDRLVAEWLAGGRKLLSPDGARPPLTVNELILSFWRWAESHYRRDDGTSTNELGEYRYTLRPLRALYGPTPAAEFSPLKLKAVRQRMIGAGWCRNLINKRVARIARMYKWAVSEELVPETAHRALKTVGGLEKGRTEARESEPVRPVTDADVEAILPYVLPPVAAMIRLQRLTGARPGEVCAMRGCDLDTSGAVWLYRPPCHKTSHRGKDRVIALGPKAQEIVRPFLRLDTQAYLFSPRAGLEQRRVALRLARKSKVQPSHQVRRRKRPRKSPGERYSTRSYDHAIYQGCDRAGIPHWHPHQLRHAHATEVRRRFGLEAAQVALGHSQANVTEIYAERNLSLAVKVAGEVG
jgi:integrase